MSEFEIEIIFISSATPKRFKVVALYDKGAFLCCQRADDIIVRYPLTNIFQVSNMHGAHCNSGVKHRGFVL